MWIAICSILVLITHLLMLTQTPHCESENQKPALAPLHLIWSLFLLQRSFIEDSLKQQTSFFFQNTKMRGCDMSKPGI